MKKNKMNLEPFDLEIRATYEGFRITIWGKTKKRRNKDLTHEITIYFKLWYFHHIVKELKRVIEQKVQEITNYRDLLK